MKRFLLAFALAAATFSSAAADRHTRSYTRKDGTFVSGYTSSSPNRTVTDNYTFKGNTNPYTGSVGHNYYRSAPSSPYYGTSTSSRNSYSYGTRSTRKR